MNAFGGGSANIEAITFDLPPPQAMPWASGGAPLSTKNDRV